MSKLALGKGLGALIPDIQKDTETINNILELELDKIQPNRNQPRTDFKDDPQNELIASIKEKGIIQPIVVRKTGDNYEIIAGERRYRAAKFLGLEKIPVNIKSVSDEEALELSLIENIQRENLNPIEESKAYEKLMILFELTQDEIATRVGKNRTTITNSIRLLKLPLDIQDKIVSEEISVGHAKVLLSLESVSQQLSLLEKILSNGLSVRETEKAIEDIKEAPVHKRRKLNKDHQIIAIEETLQRILGTKVSICQGKKKGRIEIEYYSHEDLQRVLEFIGVTDL